LNPERRLPNSDRYARTEDGDSFASTMKAIHDDNRKKSEARQAGETDAEADVKARKDKRSRIAENDTSPDEASAQTMPAGASEHKHSDLGEVPSEPASDMNATAQAESDVLTENSNPGRTGITLPSGAQSKEAAQDSMKTTAPSVEGTQAQKAALEAATVANEASETASQKVSGASKEARAPGIQTQAAQTAATARSDTSSPEEQPDKDGAQDAKAQGARKGFGDAISGKSLSAEASPSPGEGDARGNDMSEMGRFVRQLPSQAAAKSVADAREADREGTPTDPGSTLRERSSKTGPTTSTSTSSGEAVRETSFAKSNATAGQKADPIGPNHHAPSFASAATSGRAETASSAPGAAEIMPAAAERFHQDNFHQLVERALFTVRGEQSEARIALKPDQLGHVQMRVVTEHHAVHIKIMTESPVARDLIHAHAHQLKAELQQQGLTVEQIEVSVSNDQDDAYRGERQRASFLNQLASQGQSKQDDEIDPPPRGIRPFRTARGQSTGIDYFA